MRSTSTSFVLTCIVSSVPPGGWLSTPPGWSCILGGLAWLLLVFRVDTISHREVSFICKGTIVPTDGAKLMVLFQLELGLSMLDLLGKSADSGRWTPLQKRETKRIGRGSPIASPMPKSVPVEEKINCLGNEVLCICLRTFHRWGGLVFIMDDHDNFPSWMMTQKSILPCWRMIRYFSY